MSTKMEDIGRIQQALALSLTHSHALNKAKRLMEDRMTASLGLAVGLLDVNPDAFTRYITVGYKQHVVTRRRKDGRFGCHHLGFIHCTYGSDTDHLQQQYPLIHGVRMCRERRPHHCHGNTAEVG